MPRPTSRRLSGTRLLSLLLAAGLVTGLIVTAGPASAALPKTPTALSPSGIAVNANPILSWSRAPKAESYDLEVSSSPDFSRILYQANTTNQRATPTSQLPMTQIYWRLRSRNATGTSTWVSATFNRTRLAGPALTSPADGATLPQPHQPPLLQWAPLTGATGYTVEVDRGPSPDWVDSTSYDTRITSYVVPDPQENGVYAWRVRAMLGDGQSTLHSTPRTYIVGELAPVANATPNNGQDVEEVILDWDAVPGAVSYDVRVSTDDSFTAGTIIDARTVAATRYSPASATYDVDDYWWQVRARTSKGTAKEWNAVPIRSFHRAWDPLPAIGADPNPQPDPYGAPRLVYPPADQTVTGDLYYQWTPARLATSYQLYTSTDAAFSNPVLCAVTTQTTYVVTSIGAGCHPGLNTTIYWRVIAIDYPRGVNGFPSPIQKFAYSRPQVNQTSPAAGASGIEIPTLCWDPLAGAESYLVKISNTGGSVVDQS